MHWNLKSFSRGRSAARTQNVACDVPASGAKEIFMGQRNNSGRNASLDEHGRRAAGREDVGKPRREALSDRESDRGRTRGASGSNAQGRSRRRGGGGGADIDARDAEVPASSRRARRRK
jgi:hypothetical protein